MEVRNHIRTKLYSYGFLYPYNHTRKVCSKFGENQSKIAVAVVITGTYEFLKAQNIYMDVRKVAPRFSIFMRPMGYGNSS